MSGPWGDAPITLGSDQERACREGWERHGRSGYCPVCGVDRCREGSIYAAVLIQGGHDLRGSTDRAYPEARPGTWSDGLWIALTVLLIVAMVALAGWVGS